MSHDVSKIINLKNRLELPKTQIYSEKIQKPQKIGDLQKTQGSNSGNASISTKKSLIGSILKYGAGDEARTRDIFLGKEAFYH